MVADYFAVQRALLSSDQWLSEPFTRPQAWLDLIGLARWKPGHTRIKGVRIELDRGELCWSEVKLAERWQWSRGKVRRFLNELETAQQIVQQKSHVTSVISLVNYDRHQPGGQQTEQQADNRQYNRRTTDGTRKKKEKKEKKEKNIYSNEFELFWSAFPKGRKTGKAAASAAFEKATGKVASTTLIAAAWEYAASDVGRGGFVKSPAVWLNQGCWDDDRAAWKDRSSDQSAEPELKDLNGRVAALRGRA